jgi:hypothetical protein
MMLHYCLIGEIYPNCLTSPLTFNGVTHGTYVYTSCYNVVPSSITLSINSANSDYLDFLLMDEVTFSNWAFDGTPYTCLCPSICFKQGSQSSGLPNPKTGTCTISNTTNIFIVIRNQNQAYDANNIVLSGTFSPTKASSSTGGIIRSSSSSSSSKSSSTGGGLVSSTGSSSIDYGIYITPLFLPSIPLLVIVC